MLMLVGMGTVFVFLTALVGAMTLMSRLMMRLHVAAPVPAVAEDELAAIGAALTQHRRKRHD